MTAPMMNLVVLRDEIRESVQAINTQARNIATPNEAQILSEECVELAAMALRLRGALQTPERGNARGAVGLPRYD